MGININSKILLSVASIAAAAALVIGATFAFFSDTETSTGNTFTAGELDLKVDNTCYYNTLADGNPNCPAVEDDPETNELDESIVTTWESTDLGAAHKFFYFTDVKPGDFGEDTVSLTVDNDAWLRMLIGITADTENGCNGPETVAEPDCALNDDGELLENLLFTVWLDEGVTPGFQGPQDLSECDNDYVVSEEPTLISEGTVQDGEIWELDDYPPYDHLVAGDKACFGIAWKLPGTVGNEVQSDGVVATMEFQVEQYRNNPTPFVP